MLTIKNDATVLTAAGEKLGRVDRVVLDARTNEISHLIVRQGWLLKEDRVLPVDAVDYTTDDAVYLRAGIQDWDGLPLFEETYYVSADEVSESWRANNATTVQPYYFYPLPAMAPRANLLVTPYGYVTRTERNIPDESVALKEGAKVVSRDDQELGKVEKIVSDEQGKATHIVISKGLLFKEEKLVPLAWVESMTDEELKMGVRGDFLDRLPAYDRDSDAVRRSR